MQRTASESPAVPCCPPLLLREWGVCDVHVSGEILSVSPDFTLGLWALRTALPVVTGLLSGALLFGVAGVDRAQTSAGTLMCPWFLLLTLPTATGQSGPSQFPHHDWVCPALGLEKTLKCGRALTWARAARGLCTRFADGAGACCPRVAEPVETRCRGRAAGAPQTAVKSRAG